MNTMPTSSTAIRVVSIVFLSLALLLAAAFMLFGIYMEGMRHGAPGPNEFDPYYFECCIPAAYFGFLLFAAILRVPPSLVVLGSSLATVAAIAWLAYEFHRASGSYEFPSISAIIMLLAAAAAWQLRPSKRGRFDY